MFNENLFLQQRHHLRKMNVEPKFVILNSKLAYELKKHYKSNFISYDLELENMKFYGYKIVITHDEIPNGFLFAV